MHSVKEQLFNYIVLCFIKLQILARISSFSLLRSQYNFCSGLRTWKFWQILLILLNNSVFITGHVEYMNITTKFSTLKLLFFSFISCLTIERSIVYKTMDRQCESFSRIFSSATRLDNSFIFIRNTRTSSSINENWNFLKISKKFKNS